jgi:hypothetical protein
MSGCRGHRVDPHGWASNPPGPLGHRWERTYEAGTDRE